MPRAAGRHAWSLHRAPVARLLALFAALLVAALSAGDPRPSVTPGLADRPERAPTPCLVSPLAHAGAGLHDRRAQRDPRTPDDHASIPPAGHAAARARAALLALAIPASARRRHAARRRSRAPPA